MHLKNFQNFDKWNIPANWFSGRERGISAMMRVRNEEEFIVPSVLSALNLFDEIVVTLNNCTDNTEMLLKRLNQPKIKIYNYPFDLYHNGPGHDDIPETSVYDNAFYYNWSLSKTIFSHVCKWDGDMVALPKLLTLRKRVLSNDVVTIQGANLSGFSMAYYSLDRIAAAEPRFFKVTPDTYYKQGKMCEHLHCPGAPTIVKQPCFLHFKNCKNIETATQIWPSNWKEIPHFQKLFKRRKTSSVFTGKYPEELKPKMVNFAISMAKKVEDPKSQIDVFRDMGEILFGLRNAGKTGDLCEIGVKKGKTTVFLATLAETLFPKATLLSFDPLNYDAAVKGLGEEGVGEIECIKESFAKNVSVLSNHTHFYESSSNLPKRLDLSRHLVFSYIDGEHSYDAVMRDFANIYARTIPCGIIVIDDYKNQRWAGVCQAFSKIMSIYNGKVKVVRKNEKAVFIRKKP